MGNRSGNVPSKCICLTNRKLLIRFPALRDVLRGKVFRSRGRQPSLGLRKLPHGRPTRVYLPARLNQIGECFNRSFRSVVVQGGSTGFFAFKRIFDEAGRFNLTSLWKGWLKHLTSRERPLLAVERRTFWGFRHLDPGHVKPNVRRCNISSYLSLKTFLSRDSCLSQKNLYFLQVVICCNKKKKDEIFLIILLILLLNQYMIPGRSETQHEMLFYT